MDGYNRRIESIRQQEFPTLAGLTYLDHAGATLYSRSQLEAVHRDLQANLYGNPHSPNPSSRLCTDTIEQVRYRILQHFNTSPETHSVIFTAGCTAALKLLADNFDWDAQNSPHGGGGGEGKASAGCEPGLATEASEEDGASSERTGHGLFCYLSDNHTSVVGMREVARARGVEVVCLSYEDIQHGVASPRTCPSKEGGSRRNGLFAYPAQSNFSGAKYPLDLLASLRPLFGGRGQSVRWSVALDVASLVGTSPLDLSACRADFVALSFYKIFGFPTGLGALVVRNDAAKFLRKTYFGGGTVQAYLARGPFHEPKSNLSDKFEDGTLPFLDIIALRHGFDTLQKLAGSVSSISEHTFSLARYVHHALASYRHGNGAPVAVLYCRGDFENGDLQGPIVNFLLRRPDGQLVGYAEIERLASLHGIHLRTGCFCNTGACQDHLGLKDQQLLQNFQAGHTCGDEMDIIDGQPTGSVRISFGYMSTLADADKFLSFVRECFIEGAVQGEVSPKGAPTHDTDLARESAAQTAHERAEPSDLTEAEVNGQGQPDVVLVMPTHALKTTSKPLAGRVLTNIFLYPVKSCGAFEVSEWEIGPKGLLYDRHWMVVNESGVCLSQKREQRLCLIKPIVDLKNGYLWLQCQGQTAISVPLNISREKDPNRASTNFIQSRVCLDRVQMIDCGDRVADWLSGALGRPCRLLHQDPEFERTYRVAKENCNGIHSINSSSSNSSNNSSSGHQVLSLANDSPYTLLCRPSARALLGAMEDRNQAIGQREPGPDSQMEQLIGRFRGNLVVDGFGAFAEDDWTRLRIGDHMFTVPKVCIRCQMVCIDQDTAERSKEPLLTLSTFRGKKVPFGIHLVQDMDASGGITLRVGDPLTVLGTK